jgi:hypothetical protein
MLSARRQLIYWLVAVLSAGASHLVSQLPESWRLGFHLELITAICFGTLIYEIYRAGFRHQSAPRLAQLPFSRSRSGSLVLSCRRGVAVQSLCDPCG